MKTKYIENIQKMLDDICDKHDPIMAFLSIWLKLSFTMVIVALLLSIPFPWLSHHTGIMVFLILTLPPYLYGSSGFKLKYKYLTVPMDIYIASLKKLIARTPRNTLYHHLPVIVFVMIIVAILSTVMSITPDGYSEHVLRNLVIILFVFVYITPIVLANKDKLSTKFNELDSHIHKWAEGGTLKPLCKDCHRVDNQYQLFDILTNYTNYPDELKIPHIQYPATIMLYRDEDHVLRISIITEEDDV